MAICELFSLKVLTLYHVYKIIHFHRLYEQVMTPVSNEIHRYTLQLSSSLSAVYASIVWSRFTGYKNALSKSVWKPPYPKAISFIPSLTERTYPGLNWTRCSTGVEDKRKLKVNSGASVFVIRGHGHGNTKCGQFDGIAEKLGTRKTHVVNSIRNFFPINTRRNRKNRPRHPPKKALSVGKRFWF